MKILITGVTGFLGGRLAHRLEAAGHEVRGLVREGSRWDDRPAGAEAAAGDITDPSSLNRAVEGRDAIVHAAALVKMWVRDRSEFDRVNVQGLANVIAAARDSGARLVYTSSFIALGPTDGETFDENSPRRSEEFYTDYERTKWLADQLARNTPADRLDMVRLYPGVVYGPGSLTQGNYIVQLLLQHARGKLPGIAAEAEDPVRRRCPDRQGPALAGAAHRNRTGADRRGRRRLPPRVGLQFRGGDP